MDEYTFRLACKADAPLIVAFVNRHFDLRSPLVNLPVFFSYYYGGKGDALHFALAERGGQLVAVAGFIPSCSGAHPDVWVSIWVADKAAKGSGLELMAALPELTGCRTLACNNIRPETRPFYAFLGYTTGRVGHFYRLAPREAYTVARVAQPVILPVRGEGRLWRISTAGALRQSGFVLPAQNPYKDMAYLQKRYFAYPQQAYNVWACGAEAGHVPEALLVTRTVPVLGTAVLRIVDYVGDEAALPRFGPAIDALLRSEGAEYTDFYCAGLAPETLAVAGFCERLEGDGNVLPNYLSPPLFENTEYYYFTSNPEEFRLCKADGDQDRPNVLG